MSSTPPAGPPAEITHLVRERSEARAGRDWARADALKAQIEAAGWRVVDHGDRTSVGPAAAASVELDGEIRYGAAAAVPSLLDEPAATTWTVIVVASEEPDRISRLLAALRVQAPAGTKVVIVLNDPSASQSAALAPGAPDRDPIGGVVLEVLRTSTRLGYAAALNIAMRRATGEFALLADATAWPTGDALAPLAAALNDPAVAAAGGFGLAFEGPGAFQPNALRPTKELETGPASGPSDTTGQSDATAIEGAWLAFRRSDYRDLGPFDEHFVTRAWLDVWWSLRLRAGAEPEAADTMEVQMPPLRRAVRLTLPLERDDVAWPPDRSRLNRRNMYRVLDRFGWREELA